MCSQFSEKHPKIHDTRSIGAIAPRKRHVSRRKRDALPRGARRRRFFPQATSDSPSGRRGVVRGGGACRGPPRPTPRRLNGKCAFTEKARTLTNSPPPAQSFHDVDNVLVNYFTFRALKETLGQIAETDLTPNKEEYKCAPDHSPDPRAKMILEADACDAPRQKNFHPLKCSDSRRRGPGSVF